MASIGTLLSTASVLTNGIKPTSSHFSNQGMQGMQGMQGIHLMPDMPGMDPGQQVLYIIILILLTLLTMWAGAYIFNQSVVNIFPSVKKVSVLDFFGLYIVLHLLFC